MPAVSQAQRGFLANKFGVPWMREHHFANKGPLPEYVNAQRGTPNVGLTLFHRKVMIHSPARRGGDWPGMAWSGQAGHGTASQGIAGATQHPKITYPADHQVGMEVPVGGSSCAKCKFLGKDGASCGNDSFEHWNFDNAKLPAPADRYCCDFFETSRA